jgi:hypothetical protein
MFESTREKIQIGPETKRILGEIRAQGMEHGYCLPSRIPNNSAWLIQELQRAGYVKWGKTPDKAMALLITDQGAVSELLDGFIPVRAADYGPRLRTSLLAS